jgi:hypothetical protein
MPYAQTVAETKSHKGVYADWDFSYPEPPEQGGEQLPFVKCSGGLNIFFLDLYIFPSQHNHPMHCYY